MIRQKIRPKIVDVIQYQEKQSMNTGNTHTGLEELISAHGESIAIRQKHDLKYWFSPPSNPKSTRGLPPHGDNNPGTCTYPIQRRILIQHEAHVSQMASNACDHLPSNTRPPFRRRQEDSRHADCTLNIFYVKIFRIQFRKYLFVVEDCHTKYIPNTVQSLNTSVTVYSSCLPRFSVG